MQSTANLERVILETLRQLPPDRQQQVLDFTEFLHHKLHTPLPSAKPTLRQIAALPIQDRHRILAPSIAATAQDFLDDPELTEFSILDAEDWEPEEDQS
jgi:hypothetical protein